MLGDVLRNHVPWHEHIDKVMDYIKAATPQQSLPQSIQQFTQYANTTITLVKDRQALVSTQLHSLELLMNNKLTMDSLKTGFDKTIVKEKEPVTKSVKVIETIHTPDVELGTDYEDVNTWIIK